MHVETLKTFCDLVETGSFSKAAALNFISQSAVSQQVRALERRYDQSLIERGRRHGVTLTEAGRLFYSECKELLDRFQSLETRMRHRSAAITGTVRVATVYSVGLHELPPYVKQFIKAHPQVNIRVEYSRTNKIYEACLNNTIDFGIVALPLRRPRVLLRSWLLLRSCLLLRPRLLRRTGLLLPLLMIGPALAAVGTFASIVALATVGTLAALLPVAPLLQASLLLAVAVLVARRPSVAPAVASVAPGLIAPVLAALLIALLITRLSCARRLDRRGGGGGLRRSRRLE